MKPGIYALASLDESPLHQEDCDTLGLIAHADSRQAAGIRVRAASDNTVVASLHFHSTPDSLTAFTGFLDEPEELATALRSSATQSPAELAVLALNHYGSSAAQHLVGEWSMLHWSVAKRELTLLGSENTRDSLFYATNGTHIAVASDQLLLGRLPWVGLSLDPRGFMIGLGRSETRLLQGDTTIWKRIFRTSPATANIFSLGSHKKIEPAPEPSPVPWHGTFDEAIEELNTLGRHIVGQTIHRYGSTAFLLSGGLDSTLLTALGAQSHGSTPMVCLTSVAPEGSGLKDESAFSAAVADQLGLRVCRVTPSAGASPYLPLPEIFAETGGPSSSARHYLYDALYIAARAEGADAIFDGVMGEMSITEKPISGHDADLLRRIVYWTRRQRAARARRNAWPQQGFHARFSPQLLQTLPVAWKSNWRAGMPVRKKPGPSDIRGFDPGLAKNTSVATSLPYGIRRVLPFRDRRLVRFAARLPYGFGEHNGETRAMARAMLRGRVPESIRLRPLGLPFSPTYIQLVAEQAEAARQRIPIFAEAGIDRWLDLDWLDAALLRLAAGANPYSPELSQTQLTSTTAEFLLWAVTLGVKI